MTKRTTVLNVVLRRRRRRRWQKQNPELTGCMSKKANLPLTILTIFTRFSSVSGRVQPAFKNAVRKFTRVTAVAVSAAVIRANLTGVLEPERVAAASLFAGVSEGTVGPVVAAATCASADFELVHAEVVGGIGIFLGEHVGGGVGGLSAGEELSWWDVVDNVVSHSERFFEVKKKLLLLFTKDIAHFFSSIYYTNNKIRWKKLYVERGYEYEKGSESVSGIYRVISGYLDER